MIIIKNICRIIHQNRSVLLLGLKKFCIKSSQDENDRKAYKVDSHYRYHYEHKKYFGEQNIEEYEKILDEEIYLSLLSASLTDKESVIALTNRSREFVNKNYASYAEEIDNDAYVERIVESDRDDYVAKCLRKLYERRDRTVIDMARVNSKEDIVKLIKESIVLPQWCGNGWDAMNDILGEGNFPSVLEIKHMEVLEKKYPEDATLFRNLLQKNTPKYCIVKYV